MPLAKLEAFDPKLVALSGFGKALGHPARIAILQFLGGRREAAALEIVDRLPLSQPACSRHLSELVKAGLLRARVSGSNVYYRLQRGVLDRFCRSMAATLHGGRKNS